MRTASLLLLAALAACRSTPPPPSPAPGPLTVALEPGRDLRSLRGTQLGAGPRRGLVEADVRDRRTVEDLRTPTDLREHGRRTELERPGLYLLRGRSDAPTGPLTDADFDAARQIFAIVGDASQAAGGAADRAAAQWIPFRVLDQGVDLETAVAEAYERGLASEEHEAAARAYVAAQLEDQHSDDR